GVLVRLVSAALELRALLVLPVSIVLVVLAEALVELAGETADGLLVADIGGAEPAGSQAAQVLAWFDQDHALAHAGRLHGCADAAGCAAVDDDVEFPLGRVCGKWDEAADHQ